MARGFGATMGVGTTDRVSTAVRTTPIVSSWGAWTYRNGDGGASAGRVWDQGTNAFSLLSDGGLGTYRFTTTWSGGGTGGQVAWSFARPASGAWHHVAWTYDGTLTTNDAQGYIDGVAQAVTQFAADGTGALVPATAAIDLGNRSDGVRNWDGMLAGFSLANRIWTPGEVASMGAHRFSPIFYRQGLISYVDMDKPTPIDLLHPTALSVTGTLLQPHPAILYPSGPVVASRPAAAAAAVVAPKARRPVFVIGGGMGGPGQVIGG